MLGESFDPKVDALLYEHFRPHWCQDGVVVFITFRTHDSIPAEVLARWDREKCEWLRLHGFDTGAHWSEIVPQLSKPQRIEFSRTFNRHREDFLDSCQGRCLLKRPERSKIVADSLMYFDGQRYRMGDFIVMPNHVHLLAAFGTAESMKHQCDSWLHFSAYRINQMLGEKGKFWQQEPFDHLVRSPEQYQSLRRYIAENPRKAYLAPGEYHYRRLNG